MARQINITPRWRFALEGEPQAIKELERLTHGRFASPDDFIVTRMGGIPIITTTIWDEIDNIVEAQNAAVSTLRILCGALRLHTGHKALSIGTIYELTDQGMKESRLQSFNIAVINATPLSIDLFSDTLSLTEAHEWMASAILEIGGTEDWFAIYKIIEAIEEFCGGEKKMVNSLLFDGKQLKQVKRMANSFRHLCIANHKPPSFSITHGEAVAAVHKALRAAIEFLRSA